MGGFWGDFGGISSVKNLHFVDVALIDSFFDIGQTAYVQRRMRQTGVDPREAEDGQQRRHDGNDEEVVVVGRSFLQPEIESVSQSDIGDHRG